VERLLFLLPPGPTILMGDWNAICPEVQTVLACFQGDFDLGEGSQSDTHTYLSREIVLFRIFVDGLKVTRFHTRGTIATARLIVADLEV
jgi:hypothetical protein